MSRHLTLSEIEDRFDSPWTRPRPPTEAQRRESALTMPLGSGDCWCGEAEAWHDWPGKDDGAPHPRKDPA